MLDLHCHILPQIDDGARDLRTALQMLDQARRSGVDRLILTPHFDPVEQSQENFLLERERAWNLLQTSCGDLPELRLGAEVSYCAELLSLDLQKLTLGGSCYLLLELPGRSYPAYLDRITEKLLERGLIPVLAHVERCVYFRREPELLRRLIGMGALAQVTAGAWKDRRDRNFTRACLEHGLAQIVASDAHDPDLRPPRMELLEELPERLQRMHRATAEAVWENELPPYVPLGHVKSTFFGYG